MRATPWTYALLGLLFILLAGFVWAPWYQESQAAQGQTALFLRSLDARAEAIAREKEQLEASLDALGQDWRSLQQHLYRAPSTTASGAELARRVQNLAEETGVSLLSVQLLPVESGLNPVAVSADVRASAPPQALLAFLHEIVASSPVHTLDRLRLTRRAGNEVSAEIRLHALAVVGEEAEGLGEAPAAAPLPETVDRERLQAVALFGLPPKEPEVQATPVRQPVRPVQTTYESEWRLLGIIYDPPASSAALLQHPRAGGGAPVVARVGEALGDERVVEIDARRVVLRRGEMTAELSMPE